jgi:hypothetical protein
MNEMNDLDDNEIAIGGPSAWRVSIRLPHARGEDWYDSAVLEVRGPGVHVKDELSLFVGNLLDFADELNQMRRALVGEATLGDSFRWNYLRVRVLDSIHGRILITGRVRADGSRYGKLGQEDSGHVQFAIGGMDQSYLSQIATNIRNAVQVTGAVVGNRLPRDVFAPKDVVEPW